MDGEVIYHDKKMGEILKKWKSEKKLDKEVGLEVLNFIFRKCLTKSIQIAEDLRLPPPIRFPIVKTKE
jgi:hypothetical protein